MVKFAVAMVSVSASLGMLVSVQLPVQAAESNEPMLPAVAIPIRPAQTAPPSSVSPPSVGNGYPIIDDYILGAGDTIQVDVFRLPDYSGEYEVLVNGTLSLPMVGQVIVSGLTLEQAEQAVSQAYSSRLRRPIINMVLVSPRPLRVGVAGEVSRPGEYILEREGTQFPSVVNALETAGGITPSADLR